MAIVIWIHLLKLNKCQLLHAAWDVKRISNIEICSIFKCPNAIIHAQQKTAWYEAAPFLCTGRYNISNFIIYSALHNLSYLFCRHHCCCWCFTFPTRNPHNVKFWGYSFNHGAHAGCAIILGFLQQAWLGNLHRVCKTANWLVGNTVGKLYTRLIFSGIRLWI